MSKLLLSASFVAIVASGSAFAQSGLTPAKEDIPGAKKIYSPYVERTQRNSNFAEGVYWGDTHLHTSYSSDSGMIGNTLVPDEAYALAKGGTITSSTGQPVKLIRPLDFLVVSDHAEALGLAPFIAEANPDLLSTENGKRWYDMVNAGEGYEAFREWGAYMFTGDPIESPAMQRTVWDRQIDAAEKHNEPGLFTAFIGFEWTSLNTEEAPSNLHRVVIFKDDRDRANSVVPFSAYDSVDPEDLWAWMQQYEDETGGRIMAIPHNGNLSNGLMFDTETLGGEPLTREYAETRMKWEPIYEVTQIKGDGETHPLLSPTDAWADYGTWDKGDIAGVKPKTDDMLPKEYARSALQMGLKLEGELGVNPFKFGMIGSTDAHTSIPSTREENYWGKFAGGEPMPDRWEHYVIKAFSGDDSLSTFAYEELASGLAAVWARENTRDALFEGMQKKETYATTGTRITVRFFGGWDYAQDEVFRPDAVEIGYKKGVAMGGDLPARGESAAPTFMVGAMKDPWSGNLDRIQVVKGWVNAEGNLQERVFDVVCADDRAITDAHQCDGDVGNTVDEKEATYLNNIGDAELRAVWSDPEFDASLRAVYYARVLEIPTPTWQAYDQEFFEMEMSGDVPLTHQERAYTSPIWFTPES